MRTLEKHFSQPGTFLNMPRATSTDNAKVAVLGIPFDCGVDPDRIGARHGPSAIREQSRLISRYDGRSGIDPVSALNAVDLGDIALDSGNAERATQLIDSALSDVISDGTVALSFGGDGAIALGQMRALSKRYPDLCVLHIDAHTDAYSVEGYSNATPFTRASEEQLINCQRSFHIGRRGSHMVDNVYQFTDQLGYQLIDMEQLLERGIGDVMRQVRDSIGSRPVYLCFDMDFFDPSVAPGVCSPTWGGATAREGLALLKACAGLEIVAADINTISPPHDHAGMSALLAATVGFEMLMLMASGHVSQHILKR
ncbi:MAG: arginase family protein [Pseudomonadales bacterium]